MNKAFTLFLWENEPSVNTPLGETLLNKVNVAVNEIDNRVITHETTKANQADLLTAIADVSLDESTGIITFTKKNGATTQIDTKLEKLAINFNYDKENQQLVITLDDGTLQYVDMKALITELEFLNSDTVLFSVTDGKVSASIAKGSITADMIETNYLANVQLYAELALASEQNAKDSEYNAKVSEQKAKVSENVASEKADTATTAENNANAYAEQAKSSEVAAGNSATTAIERAAAADNSAKAALTSEANAKESEDNAKTSAEKSFAQASTAESYTKGGTGTRDGEDTDNAKYYMEQTKAIAGTNIAINDQTPTYTVASENADLKSGEKMSTAFGKIAKAVSSLISHLADAVSHITPAERTAWNSKAAGVHKHTKSEITDFPTSLPASDVYDWAKASSKPSYTKDEVGLGNVENKSSSTIRSEITKADVTNALGYTPPASDTNTWRPLGTTADTACAGNDSRLSNARPASDVCSWAKAASKPAYTKAEVGLGNVDNTADSAKSVKYAVTAGSATNAANATNAGNADTVDGYHITSGTVDIGVGVALAKNTIYVFYEA